MEYGGEVMSKSEEGKEGLKKSMFEEIVAIKVASPNDIVRLAASSISLGQFTYLIRFSINGKKILGTLAVFRDYYDMKGIPLFYYIDCHDSECGESKYASFKIDESGEKVKFTNKNIPGTIMVPIIEFKQPPPFIGIE
jgi:hypothetical protein